jgi:CheY-specific phosphatase CheX
VEVLSEGFLVDPRLEGVCFRGWARPLSEVNATIPLCGPTISGRLSASVAPEVARRIYQRMLPTEPEPSERTLQDLVGEMCNQVLGGLKRALARHGVDFAVGVPMMWSGTGCPARYRSLAGSTLLTVADRDTQDRVRVDLTLDSLVGEYVQATDGVECATGELAFL